jgi:hypothetical protein
MAIVTTYQLNKYFLKHGYNMDFDEQMPKKEVLESLYQVTIIEYKADKYFYIKLINTSIPANELKFHAYAGFQLYDELLNMCIGLYGFDIELYNDTIDEEIFLLRGKIITRSHNSKILMN